MDQSVVPPPPISIETQVQPPAAPLPPAAAAPPAPPPAAPPPPAALPKVYGSGGAEVPDEAISEVKAKERKRLLKAEFGTDDPAQIEQIKLQRSADLDELKRLREADETRKRETMTEVDRLKADLEKANLKITDLTQQLEGTRTEVVAQKQAATMAQIISAHKFKEKYVPWVNEEIAKYFKALTKTDQAKFGRASINAWLAKYAKENPELTEAAPPPSVVVDPAAPPAPPAAPPPPKRVLASNGKPVVPPKVLAPPPAVDPLAGKTARPNQPNSMTDKELKEHMARQGMRKSW
jgi:hypothetical protein